MRLDGKPRGGLVGTWHIDAGLRLLVRTDRVARPLLLQCVAPGYRMGRFIPPLVRRAVPQRRIWFGGADQPRSSRGGREPLAGARNFCRLQHGPLYALSRAAALRVFLARAARRARGYPRPLTVAAVRSMPELVWMAEPRDTDDHCRARDFWRLLRVGAGACPIGRFRPGSRRSR